MAFVHEKKLNKTAYRKNAGKHRSAILLSMTSGYGSHCTLYRKWTEFAVFWVLRKILCLEQSRQQEEYKVMELEMERERSQEALNSRGCSKDLRFYSTYNGEGA